MYSNFAPKYSLSVVNKAFTIAKESIKEYPESYSNTENFLPHAWVLAAICEGITEGIYQQNSNKNEMEDWRLSETNKEKEMKVVNNGWIDRTSDLCPVADNVLIDVILRNGYVATSILSDEMVVWSIGGRSHDIVGWKLSEKVTTIPVKSVTGKVIDNVNNPSHYTSHKSGVECIDVTRHMSFNLGNATKYIWRCDLKKDAIEDLRKAIFYLNDEIEMRLKAQKGN